MRIIAFSKECQARAGVVIETGAVDIFDLGLPGVSDLCSLIRLGSDGLKGLACALEERAWPTTPLDQLALLAPAQAAGRNIFCIGRNYLGHVEEGYRAREKPVDLPQAPQIFTKPRTALASSGEVLTFRKSVSDRMDYEGELGIVIGRPGKDISDEDALDHIFGFTVINDITARDLQRRHDQWFKGKSLDQSCPMGPCIITRDEVADVRNLEIVTKVNGQVRQSAKVSQMIFDIPTIIAELSKGMTLEAGDIIASGTPEGVGYAMADPQFLANGDVVSVSIEGIGELVNRIVLE